MRGFTRKNGRLALAAAAVLALGQVAVQKANATTVFDSGGFESYSNGALYGQGQAPGFGALNTTSQSSSSFAVTGTGGNPGKAVQLNWTSAGGTIGAAPLYPSPTNIVATYGPLVTVTTDLSYTAATGTGVDGPFIGLKAFGNNGAAPAIAAVGVDAATGELVDFTSSGGYNTFADDAHLAAGTYATLTLAFNFATQQVTESVSGPVSDSFTTSFASPTFYAAYLAAESTGGPDPVSATANFDNYVITANSAVPEPASLGLLSLAGVGMLARRVRRSAVVA